MADESIETEIDISKPNDVEGASILPVQKPAQKEEPPDDIDLEIVDDTPPEDRNRPKPPKQSAIGANDEDVSKYSQGVQKRLQQMKLEYHEERRQKDAAMREHGVAIDMAKRIRQENEQLRRMVEESHKSMVGSSKSATDSELAALRENIKAAHEAGDSGKLAELQEKMSKAAARSVALEQTQPLKFEEQPKEPERQPQQRVQLSTPMQAWMQDNPWFNAQGSVERRMTGYAFGLHDSLLRDGVTAESPAYFKAINDEMRTRFPEYYGDDTGNGVTKSPPQRRTVGSADRLAGGGPVGASRSKTKVTLSQSEIAVAKRVGVSPEAYAREKLKAMESDNG